MQTNPTPIKVGDKVRLKGKKTTTTIACIACFLGRSIPGGVRLTKPLGGLSFWNVSDLEKVDQPPEIQIPKLKSGDLIYGAVTIPEANLKYWPAKTVTSWFLIHEVGVDNQIISGNLSGTKYTAGTKRIAAGLPPGYGRVINPRIKPILILRGKHGTCSPFAALNEMTSTQVIFHNGVDVAAFRKAAY